MRSLSLIYALSAVALLVGCGEVTDTSDGSETENPCPAIDGETHLAVDDSESGAALMLHVVGTECLVVGANTMAIHGYLKDDADDHDHMAPGYQPSSMMDPDAPKYIVEAVRATMPSMGHGTHEDPVVPADSNQFEVNFQMAGEWQLEVDFHAEATMETTDTTEPMTDSASFTVTVH